MTRTPLLLAATAVVALAVPALANAQPPWVSIHDREVRLDSRIDEAVRSHQITRGQAADLRAQFRNLEQEEAHDRATRPGLTPAERADLDRRFDALAGRLNFDKRVDSGRPGAPGIDFRPLDERRADLASRIDRAQSSGRLTRRDARGLRMELDNIGRAEAHDRGTPPGLTPRERDDLNARMDGLSARIHDQAR